MFGHEFISLPPVKEPEYLPVSVSWLHFKRVSLAGRKKNGGVGEISPPSPKEEGIKGFHGRFSDRRDITFFSERRPEARGSPATECINKIT